MGDCWAQSALLIFWGKFLWEHPKSIIIYRQLVQFLFLLQYVPVTALIPQLTVSQEIRLNLCFENLFPPAMGWSCQSHCGFFGSYQFCTCGGCNESCKLWSFSLLLVVSSRKVVFLTCLRKESCMAKVGHSWSGTVFQIPASKVSAEATGGWVSYRSMHYFFDSCRWICCVAATKGNERKGIHFPFKKKPSALFFNFCFLQLLLCKHHIKCAYRDLDDIATSPGLICSFLQGTRI